jgi:hypothetical protein
MPWRPQLSIFGLFTRTIQLYILIFCLIVNLLSWIGTVNFKVRFKLVKGHIPMLTVLDTIFSYVFLCVKKWKKANNAEYMNIYYLDM